MAVAKSFAVLSLISFNVFYELSNILIPVVYITLLKNIDLLRWVYKKSELTFWMPTDLFHGTVVATHSFRDYMD